jgi:hypothetical protein
VEISAATSFCKTRREMGIDEQNISIIDQF